MTSTLLPLDAALSYARLGWPVVPLHTPVDGVCDCRKPCTSPGKHPRLMRGVDDSSTDEQKIRHWWHMWPTANVGVDLVRGGILDIAPDSLQWQAEFIARGLPHTVSFRSGGGDGHEHHFYRRTDTCPAYRLCRTDEYDIMSAGYAVMPPSVHESGKQYAWLQEPSNLPLPAAPAWVVSLLQEHVRSRHNLNGTALPLDTDEAPVQLSGDDQALWAGQSVRLKLGGGVDRSLSLWEIGTALARAGASRSAIARALQDRDEALGWSKYTGRRDAATRYLVIADRALSGQAPRIRLKPADPSPTTAGTATGPARRFRLLTADELKNRPDPEWLVDGILQKDTLALLVGTQETLKTFTALDIALSVSTARAWQDHLIETPGLAVYVSAEGGSGLGLRLAAWEIAHDVVVDQRCYFLADQAPQFLDRKDDGDVAELLAALNDLPERPAIIVIDTVARSMVGGDENSAQDMGLLIASADQIRQATGAVILLVHHNNKAGSARGSSALLGAVHTIIETSREENSPFLVLRCGKQKDAEHFSSLMLEAKVVEAGANKKTGVVRTSLVLYRRGESAITLEPQLPALTNVARTVFAVLIDLQEASYSQWRDASKVANTTFRRVKAALVTDGYVAHDIDRYRPSEAGLEAWGQMGPNGAMALNGPEADRGATLGPKVGPDGGAPLGGDPWPLGPMAPEASTADGGLPW